MYAFQRNGLQKETQTPFRPSWMPRGRFSAMAPKEMLDVPVHFLGLQVIDSLSGFSGMLTEIIIHPNGCVHGTVQPAGQHEITFETRQPADFALTQLKRAKLVEEKFEEEDELTLLDIEVLKAKIELRRKEVLAQAESLASEAAATASPAPISVDTPAAANPAPASTEVSTEAKPAEAPKADAPVATEALPAVGEPLVSGGAPSPGNCPPNE